MDMVKMWDGGGALLAEPEEVETRACAQIESLLQRRAMGRLLA